MQRDDLYGLRVRPGRVKVKIGKPISFGASREVTLENARRISAELRKTIAELMQQSS
jgi:hypothetical protein